jgi:hypothetical protein
MPGGGLAGSGRARSEQGHAPAGCSVVRYVRGGGLPDDDPAAGGAGWRGVGVRSGR